MLRRLTLLLKCSSQGNGLAAPPLACSTPAQVLLCSYFPDPQAGFQAPAFEAESFGTSFLLERELSLVLALMKVGTTVGKALPWG